MFRSTVYSYGCCYYCGVGDGGGDVGRKRHAGWRRATALKQFHLQYASRVSHRWFCVSHIRRMYRRHCSNALRTTQKMYSDHLFATHTYSLKHFSHAEHNVHVAVSFARFFAAENAKPYGFAAAANTSTNKKPKYGLKENSIHLQRTTGESNLIYWWAKLNFLFMKYCADKWSRKRIRATYETHSPTRFASAPTFSVIVQFSFLSLFFPRFKWSRYNFDIFASSLCFAWLLEQNIHASECEKKKNRNSIKWYLHRIVVFAHRKRIHIPRIL